MSVYAWHTAATIKLDGQELAPDVAARVVTVQVRDNVRLPDQASVRIADPELLRDTDGASVSIGQTLEILLGAPDATTTTSIFSGKVQSLELELVGDGAFIAATAYESAFELHRSRRTQVFQSMTSSDIASKVISDAGLTPVVDSTTTQHDFMLQCDESDWQFLWRLAADIDYEVVGEGAKVHFRAAGKTGTGDPIELGSTDQLLSFRPRVTAAQQVSSVSVRGWDPSQQSAIVANKAPAATDSSPGLQRSTVSGAVGSGTWTVAERTILTQTEADDLGQSIADQIGNAWLEAEGTCVGKPNLTAGSQVKIAGVGSRFDGTYLVTSATHVLTAALGYQTHFTVSGRSAGTLLDLIDAPETRPPWGSSLVVGVVTQTSDPDSLGRVRVKYPVIGDNAEGWWARIAAPAAGTNRGMLMMPLVGDEVVLGFEQGDPRRPYVIGAVWNGAAKPGEDLVKQDGSFVLASDKDVTLTAQQNATISAPKGELALKGKTLSVKSDGALTITGANGAAVTLGDDGSVTVKGASVTVQAQANLQLSASGTVQIKGAMVMLG